MTVSTLTVVSETTVSGTAPAAEPFTFYLGTHQPHWLRLGLGVPLFVSDRRLRGYRTLPRAEAVWALDSGGFNELSQYGTWDNGPPPASTRPGCAATAMRSAALGGRRRRTGCANPTSSPRPD